MNTAIAAIGKNIVLVVLLLLTFLSFFNALFTWSELLAVQSVMGLIYVFLSCYEYNNASYKSQLPIERFPYYPSGFFMFRMFKIGIYLLFAFSLSFANSGIKYLYPICLIIAFTELVVNILKYYKKLCYVSLYANYIFIAKEKLIKIFAGEVESIEYRHDIIHIVKKNKKSEEIKLFSMQNHQLFLVKIKEWMNNNQIPTSAESAQRFETDIKAIENKVTN